MPNLLPSFCHITVCLSNGSKDKESSTCHPGDLLTGDLWIQHGEHAIIDDVVLSFEGLTRIWVDHDSHASAVQYDFLKQSQRFSRHERKEEKLRHGTYCHMPFEFRIASRCFPNALGVESQLAMLPPSLAVGEVSLDRRGNKCMQPLITYGLRAVVHYRPSARSPRLQAQEFHEIVFAPWTEAAPPLSIDDFPQEFCLSATRDVRKRLSFSSLGEITVSISEPPPLVSSTTSPRPRTRGLLGLSLTSSKLLEDSEPPRWSCQIRLEIIRKIYFSTMPLTEVASNRLMQNNEYLRRREEVVHTQVWTVNPLCWDQPSSKTTCTASIPLTVIPTKQLLPTFSMPLSTLRYSFRVNVRIAQVSHLQLEVEAPLQVHTCRRVMGSTSSDRNQSVGSELPPAYFT